MKKYFPKKIAIVGRVQMTQNYENILSTLGALPETLLSIGSLQNYDLLLLPGGGDITPAFFGQKNRGSANIDTELDILQIQALDLFVKQKKPVLGICKGIQLINVFFGGSICQHLSTASYHAYHEADQFHTTMTCPGSILHRLYGPTFTVNSAHHQGIDRLGKELMITQTSPDGVIEGIEHENLPIWGVQWHPERLIGTTAKETATDGSLLIREFLSISL